MILLTGVETGLAARVDDKDIVHIESMRSGRSSFSRIFLKDKKQNHDFYLDVKEDLQEIKRRIKHEQLDPGCEARAYSEL